MSRIRAQIEQWGPAGLLAREELRERAARARGAARMRRWVLRAFAGVVVGLALLGASRSDRARLARVEECLFPPGAGWVDVSAPSALPSLASSPACREVSR